MEPPGKPGRFTAVFDRDLAARGAKLRLALDRRDAPALPQPFAAAYPEAVPVGAGPSIYDPV